MRIDLHAHSNASDGTDTPADLVRNAAAAGLDAVAITDHDTTAGWEEATAALPAGLRLIRGAELSCSSEDGRGGSCDVHLLGYLFDPRAEAIVHHYEHTRTARRGRLRHMAEQMAADGLPIDPDALLAGIPADVTPGRPHLARALVSAGVVDTVGDAFNQYLHDTGKYWLPSSRTPVRTWIELINQAGGVAVFAHPFASRRGPTVTAEVIVELIGHGLAGVEVDHPDHDADARRQLRALAAEHDLLVTGSSDYHGANKVQGLGAETTAPEVLEAIADRATGAKVIIG